MLNLAIVPFFLLLCEFGFCQWPVHGGNAQNTGVVVTAIGEGKNVTETSHKLSNGARIDSRLIMNTEGIFFASGGYAIILYYIYLVLH
jgi:hypothetical protein